MNYSQDSLTRTQKSRAYRLRQQLLPETNAPEFYNTTESHYGANLQHLVAYRSTAVHRLVGPAQQLGHAIINIINYQEDADASVAASDELVHLMSDEDPHTEHRAVQMTHQLAKKHASRYGLVTREEVVRCLFGLIERNLRRNNRQTLEEIMSSIWQLSRCEQGAQCIFRCLIISIPTLIEMLRCSQSDAVMTYALNTLHNLLLYIDQVKPEIRKHGGVQAFADLLPVNSEKHLAVVVDCLHMLAYNNQETKIILHSLGSIPLIVNIMGKFLNEKLLYCTSRLLTVLSVCPTCKPTIVEANGMQVLSLHLRSTSERLCMSVLWSLRNLSDQAYMSPNLDHLLDHLIHLINSDNDNMMICAVGCICNLSCQNENNKITLIRNGAVEVLSTILVANVHREEISEPVLCSLRNLTHRNPLARDAAIRVEERQGLSVVAHFYSEEVTTNLPITRAVTGLAVNLAAYDDFREQMRDLNIQFGLMSALNQCYTGIQQFAHQRASLVSMQSELSYVDGVRLVDMCELVLSGLQAMAKDVHARADIVHNTDVLAIAVRLLHNDSEYVARAATGLLCELAVDKEGAKAIEREGATSRLTELLHHRNETIATYAAAVLYRLSEDKPPAYRDRLSAELQQSLIDAGIISSEGVYLGVPDAMAQDQNSMLFDKPLNYGTLNSGIDPYANPAIGHDQSYQSQIDRNSNGRWFPDTDL